MAVNCLLDGKYVLAVLPTGLSNSQLPDISDFDESGLLKQARRATVLVQYYALNSILEDEIFEAHGLGITTASQRFVSEEELKSANFQPLFSSAKSALDMKFLNTLNLM